ncbi:MAG: HlyD family efflux transporter periplasmic adaptor subunit [Phycisphaerae bacterium]
MDSQSTSQPGLHGREPSTGELVDRLSRFDGPPEHFLLTLLAVQCHIASASGGVIFRSSKEGSPEVLAVYPPLAAGATAPVWLAHAVESAPAVLAKGATTVKTLQAADDLYGVPAQQWLIMVPLRNEQRVRGLAAFVVATSDPSVVEISKERLELTISLLSLYEMRLTIQQRAMDLRRLRLAMETLAAVDEHDRFTGSAMAFCNELASRWSCQRVGLGFLKGRYVQLAALSHTEKINRKMKLVQDIESAMEECLDQNLEILHPADAQATYISRATTELSNRQGPAAIVSLPLRRKGEPVAVATLERQADEPFGADELEALRLTCDLCTARLVNLYEHGRWFGVTLAAKTRRGLATLLGPKHTWVKAAAVAVFVVLVFLVFARGDYQAEAPCVIEAIHKQVVPAPFDGFLKSASVRPPDRVQENSVLGELDTAELRLDLSAAKAEQAGYLRQVTAAMRDASVTRDPSKFAESQIAQASADALAEKIKVLEHHIAQARLTSPINGIVVVGDLERQIGAPVKTGDVLFEIAQLESLRAELSVPEDQIADIREGQTGQLATVSHPDQRLDFIVERINPVAEMAKQKNVFKVRVRFTGVDLAGRHDWLRPGMEGMAHVQIGKRPYVWLWTHRLVNWVRMRLWL